MTVDQAAHAAESAKYPPGSQIEVRDEEWLVRNVTPTAHDGDRIEAVGVSEFVRDQEAVFFTALDDVQLMDPRRTRLTRDDSPNFRRSRLFLEAVLRKTPLPQSERGLALADSFLLDSLPYQHRPAQLALSGKNLRPRMLIADVVGLGKTLEIGMTLAELIRRGRGERILVVTPQHVLEQFQHELWTRFAIPLIRLDSVGIERIQREIPAGRNPFTYFKRVIVSIDTLKNTAQYKHHLERIRWDAVVIDESHNLINRGSLRNQLARILAPQTDALILASATPHNGDARSFAELISLLDPAAIRDPERYEAADIEHLFIRRTKISPEVREQMKGQWADRGPSMSVHCAATAAEERVFEELAEVWLPRDGRSSVSESRLFPYTVLKSFLSSHVALAATVDARIKTLTTKEYAVPGPELDALHRLKDLTADMSEQDSSKFETLVEQLRSIGIGPKSDTRVVVFSERVQTLEWLRRTVPAALGFKGKALQEAARVMHGGLSDEQQMQCVEDFGLADTPVRILFTGDVASEGVNLHRQCHQLVHYDVPWSLIRIEQRNGRIDRYGQSHPPQFRALILTSEVEGAKDDRTVAERLLEREDEAHRSMGTAEAVSGLYRADAEEKSLIQDLLRGRTVDESLDATAQAAAAEDSGTDFLADFFGAVGDDPDEVDGDAPPAPADVPRLFTNTREFIDEAMREAFPESQRELELDQDPETGLISFRPPSDLTHRLKALPLDYRREQRLHERLLVTLNRKLADLALVRARESSTSSWPEISLLTDLHPVMEWLTDKVLVRLGRQEAPVITANVKLPVYLIQGIFSNALGRPTVVKWMTVQGRTVTDDMVGVLRDAGIGPTMANPLHNHDLDLLSSGIPAALEAAEDFLRRHSAEWDRALLDPIEKYKERLGTWEQPTLAGPDTKSKLTDLADSLLTTGRPMLRILAVLDSTA
ncbi:DEAD/DEAH box helicase [Streptomyces sp. NBC_00882]|uniref:DEAD/DEAH box helicase n=1 Tax=Streptomyces TaxID=1883 RepID=UPI003864C7B4|nr:DEAD/DEAH box helicase [Streptomyces sp. NBC_00882]WSZ57127.1 DEAD/DEAH box helicase [Streptomyces canus]